MASLMDEGLADGSAEPINYIDEIDEQNPLLADLPDEPTVAQNFYENLAEHLDESELSSLSAKLIEGVDDDLDSRKEWETTNNKVLKYLGLKIEEYRDVPFMRACAAFDTTLSTALYKSYAIARAELFPNSGPCKGQIIGTKNDERQNQAMCVENFVNHYLTTIDKEYYPDSERLLMYTLAFGNCFRKVYFDPILMMPVARHIAPQDLIVDNNCTNLLSSPRITHVIYMDKKDVQIKQEMGIYRKAELIDLAEDNEPSQITKSIQKIEGVDTSAQENKTQVKLYEINTDLQLKIDKDIRPPNMAVPYIVTIDTSSLKVLSIVRNWKEGDDKFRRKNLFVPYGYMPGFGMYRVGIFALGGSNAIALTSIERQQIDAGTLKNFPGGLRKKGLKIEKNDKAVGPSEFLEVETGGEPIGDSIMLMPYGEPSSVLMQLRAELRTETLELLGVGETPISENRADAPVGTTLALLEEAKRSQTTVMRTLIMGLSTELQYLFDLFAEHLPDMPYAFDLPGKEAAIVKSYFNKNIGIVPVADPNLTTSTQRILNAEARLKLSSSNPQMHNLYEAYHHMYQTMGLSQDEINKILPPPKETPPLDPISENAQMMQSKPVKAAAWQDHQAHIMVHTMLMQNPASAPLAQAHIAEHQAMDYLNKMQAEMGQQLPPLEQLAQNPELQNQIAFMAAEITKKQMDEQAAQAKAQQPPSPQEVMLMDIQQRQEAAALKHKEAELRAETEAFKTQTNFETEKMKLDMQKDMAQENNDVKLAVEEMKLEEKQRERPLQ